MKISKNIVSSINETNSIVAFNPQIESIDLEAYPTFTKTNLKEVYVCPSNKNFYSKDNCIIDKNTKTVILAGQDYRIPKEAKSLSPYLFNSMLNITKFQIPESIAIIPKRAFSLTSIQDIVIPPHVKKIEKYAFLGCRNLQNIIFTSMDTELEEGALGLYNEKPGILQDKYIALDPSTYQTPIIHCLKGSKVETYLKNHNIPYTYNLKPINIEYNENNINEYNNLKKPTKINITTFENRLMKASLAA